MNSCVTGKDKLGVSEMAKILVVGESKQVNKLWEDYLRQVLGEHYISHEIRYIESHLDSLTSLSFTTNTYKGIREARGDPEQLKREVDDSEILVQMAPVTAEARALI